MDKGVAPCSLSSRPAVLPVCLRAHKWPHGSSYELEMHVDPLQGSEWWNEWFHDIVQVLGHLPSVWGSCGGLLGIMYQAFHHPPKSGSLVVSKHRWSSMEWCLLLRRPMALDAHPMCQCRPLGVRISYRETKPKWNPAIILHKIQCVP